MQHQGQEMYEQLQEHHRYTDLVYNEQNKLYVSKKLEQKAQERIKCLCSLCQFTTQGSLMPGLELRSKQIVARPNDTARDYLYLIRKLQPPEHLESSLRIAIPETCVLNEKGETEYIIMCNKEDPRTPHYKYQFLKQKYNFSNLRKVLIERRRLYKRQVDMIHFTLKKDPIQQNSQHSNISQLMSNGYLLSENLQKSKLNPNITIKSKIVNKRSRQESQEANFEKSIQESLLLKYQDGTHQVLSEAEIVTICLSVKRYNWGKVLYAQQYYKPLCGYDLKKVKFNYEEHSNSPLFKLAENEILNMNGEISKASEDYISVEREEDFEQKLINNDELEYLYYVTYKIYHFILKFHKTKLINAEIDYLRDDLGQYLLLSADHIYTQACIIFHHNPEFALQLGQEKQLGQLNNQSYLPNEQGDNIQHREDVEEIKTMLTQTYKMKNFVPGEVTNFKPPYDQESDLVYMKLYPNSNAVNFSKRKRQFPNRQYTQTLMLRTQTPAQNQQRSLLSEVTLNQNLISFNSNPNNARNKKFQTLILRATGTLPEYETKMTHYTRPQTSKQANNKNFRGENYRKITVGQRRHWSSLSTQIEKREIKKNTLPFFLFQDLNLSDVIYQ